MCFAKGIKDANCVLPDATLGSLGLDSLSSVEIKQLMARHYNIVVSDNEIRSLTFTDLDRLQSSSERQDSAKTPEVAATSVVQQTFETDHLKYLQPTETVVNLNKMTSENGDAIFVMAPLDGSFELLRNVMSRVHTPVYGLQCTDNIPLTSIPDMASEYIKVS